MARGIQTQARNIRATETTEKARNNWAIEATERERGRAYNDFSRKTWIYFLKKKDEVFSWFRSFKALVENQIGKKIKILRTDNGTEDESNEFNDYCREAGIKRETTTAYTPEQNGVAERKNRSIIEATCAMLHDQSLLKFLWLKFPTLLCTFKIDALIKRWTPKLPKKLSLVRNPMFLTLEFLVAPYIFMCQKKREANWMLLGRKEHLWATMKLLRHIKSMCLVKEKWR